MKRTILLADCQSFYASVEKASRPWCANKPLVVAGDPERRSGIVLAACPMAKKFGISTADRIGEALNKCSDLVVIRPRMQTYIDISLLITRIYESFTDQVECYSIDEQFMDVTGSIRYFGSLTNIVQGIQHKVMLSTGVWVRIGASTTKVLAKLACDMLAKKNESGFAYVEPEHMSELLWNHPIEEMFGVGRRMKRHCQRLGIYTIGDLARTPLDTLKQRFRLYFGKNSDIQAELLWRTANGIDESPVKPATFDIAPKSIGHMNTLPRDYVSQEEVETALLDLTDEVCRDARRAHFVGGTVMVAIVCAPFDDPTGFFKQMKLPTPTNSTLAVFEFVQQLFRREWNGLAVRQIGVTLATLQSDEVVQVSLFDDPRRMSLEHVTDWIKDRFGSAAIMSASSLTDAGLTKARSVKIGGHAK